MSPSSTPSKAPLQPTVYTGTFIHTLPEPSVHAEGSPPTPIATLVMLEGAVSVDEKGVIVNIASSQEFEKNRDNLRREGWAIVDPAHSGRAKGKEVRWWFPGFVDTHIHASQLPNAGIFGKSTLLDWLNTYTFPLESSLGSLETARRVYDRAVEGTLTQGTTTASYYATIHAESTNLLADICLAKGQRAFIGRVCMDTQINPDYYRDASPEQAIKDTKTTIDHIAHIDPSRDLLCPILTPRFAPSCSPALLKGLGDLVGHDRESQLPIQTHISENLPECALVRELFPDQLDYASVYDAYGLFTSRTVLAHAVHLSAEERRLVKARECGVSHCPVSNTSLSSGLCPVRTLLDEGVKVGLGTDVSGGCSSSVLVAAREAAMVSRTLAAVESQQQRSTDAKGGDGDSDRKKLSVEECLFLATQGGADVLGLGHRVGSFEVGKEWDAQLIAVEALSLDGDEAPPPDEHHQKDIDFGFAQVWGQRSWSEKVAQWVFCGDDRNTKRVYVKGRLVHER